MDNSLCLRNSCRSICTFSILVEGINGIVRQGIVIVGIVGEVLDFPGFLVVSVYSSFCGNPQCFFVDGIDVSYKDTFGLGRVR